MTPVSIKIEDLKDYVIIHLGGDFASLDDSEKIREIFKTLADEDKKNVLIDLKNVFYLNSATLSAFLSGSSIMNKVNGKIVLYNPSDYLKNIFNITKLNLTFAICESYEEASAALKA